MNQSHLTSARLPAPDLIRGIALIGIGAENILSFNAANEHVAYYAARFSDPLNLALLQAFMIFFRSNFYPVFALLFGFGAALSLAQRGNKPFFRRSVFMALLGLGQLIFIWSGDVLLQYAVLGMLLFAMKSLPDRLLLYPGILLLVISFIPPEFLPAGAEMEAGIPAEVYAKGSFFTLLHYRLEAFVQSTFTFPFLLFLGRIMAFMLFGFLIGRSKIYQKILQPEFAFHVLKMLGFALIFTGLGLQFSGLRGIAERPFPMEIVKMLLQFIFFAANVMLIIFLPLFLFLKWRNWQLWKYFIAAGRLTLTHYLFQNLLFSFVFYGYGLGCYLKIPPLQLWAGYSLLIIIQMGFSVWWLRNMGMGPVEKVLRRFAYS